MIQTAIRERHFIPWEHMVDFFVKKAEDAYRYAYWFNGEDIFFRDKVRKEWDEKTYWTNRFSSYFFSSIIILWEKSYHIWV